MREMNKCGKTYVVKRISRCGGPSTGKNKMKK